MRKSVRPRFSTRDLMLALTLFGLGFGCWTALPGSLPRSITGGAWSKSLHVLSLWVGFVFVCTGIGAIFHTKARSAAFGILIVLIPFVANQLYTLLFGN